MDTLRVVEKILKINRIATPYRIPCLLLRRVEKILKINRIATCKGSLVSGDDGLLKKS